MSEVRSPATLGVRNSPFDCTHFAAWIIHDPARTGNNPKDMRYVFRKIGTG